LCSLAASTGLFLQYNALRQKKKGGKKAWGGAQPPQASVVVLCLHVLHLACLERKMLESLANNKMIFYNIYNVDILILNIQ